MGAEVLDLCLFSLESRASLNSLAAVEEVGPLKLFSSLDAEFCYICTSEIEITISLLSER